MKKVQNVLRLHRCQGHFNIENVTCIMHYIISVDINS